MRITTKTIFVVWGDHKTNHKEIKEEEEEEKGKIPRQRALHKYIRDMVLPSPILWGTRK